MSLQQSTISFTLTADEAKRYANLIDNRTGKQPKWFYVLILVGPFANFFSALRAMRNDPFERFIVATYAMLFLALLIALFFRRTSRIMHSCDIAVDGWGMRGTTDRKPVALPWKKIGSVIDLGDAIAIVPTPFTSHPIAIPKRTLDDPHAFWQQLADRLTGKRGLMLGSTPRTTITNTAHA